IGLFHAPAMLVYILYFHIVTACFFFSSGRRHTRCLSDWSSDVCSSDLGDRRLLQRKRRRGRLQDRADLRRRAVEGRRGDQRDDEIGRASCRERVEERGDAVSLRIALEDVEGEEVPWHNVAVETAHIRRV